MKRMTIIGLALSIGDQSTLNRCVKAYRGNRLVMFSRECNTESHER